MRRHGANQILNIEEHRGEQTRGQQEPEAIKRGREPGCALVCLWAPDMRCLRQSLPARVGEVVREGLETADGGVLPEAFEQWSES